MTGEIDAASTAFAGSLPSGQMKPSSCSRHACLLVVPETNSGEAGWCVCGSAGRKRISKYRVTPADTLGRVFVTVAV